MLNPTSLTTLHSKGLFWEEARNRMGFTKRLPVPETREEMIQELTRIKNRVGQYADTVPVMQQYLQHKCDNLQAGGSSNALRP